MTSVCGFWFRYRFLNIVVPASAMWDKWEVSCRNGTESNRRTPVLFESDTEEEYARISEDDFSNITKVQYVIPTYLTKLNCKIIYENFLK
jgi:hypothetical protein